jgi:hypothetical protein
MGAQERPVENRRFERTKVLWSGHLIYREQSVGCIIVNIAAGGAMVRSDDPAFVMTPVVLRNSRIGDLTAEVVWRRGNELGLKFVDNPETVAAIIGRALK